MHSANKNFRDDKQVTLEDFIEWHAFVNTQIERDCEFRNFIIGVWNLDTMENFDSDFHTTTNFIDSSIAGKRAVAFPAKNSHEQWKHDFHRSQFGQPTIVEHLVNISEPTPLVQCDRPAGIRQSDFE